MTPSQRYSKVLATLSIVFLFATPVTQTERALPGVTSWSHQPSPAEPSSLSEFAVPGRSDTPMGYPPPATNRIADIVPQGGIGTALYMASATWCAPTATQCLEWGGDAKLAAVHSFHDGDTPYGVRVSYRGRHTFVTVVSFCQCGGSDAAIDLSPSAFRELAPLRLGRIRVLVEGPIAAPGPPPTDTDPLQ